ncbi:MAG: transglutaminase domain-containing protein [Burkholderiales bacterium]|nr:transglutaminase domain-containing protein [Burkholderiales bacterium]
MQGEDDDPSRWLGDTPMLNLANDRLRLRVQTVTQFSRNDKEKLLSISRYVAAIPFDVPPVSQGTVVRVTLGQRRSAGWYSKAALFEAMLRVAGFPARIRMITIGPRMYRGLVDEDRGEFVLPVVEVWIANRWVITDQYVYDPPYLAAAREAVQRRGWRSGYGVHLDGQTDWDAENDALAMIVPSRPVDGKPPEFLGVYDDPQGLAGTMKEQSRLRWLAMQVRNRMMSFRMHRQIRKLRQEAGG